MSDENLKRESEGNIFKEAFSKWLGLFLVLVAVGALCFAMININHIFAGIAYIIGIMRPVLYGCVIAYILNPLMKMYKRGITNIMTRNGRVLSEKAEGWIDAGTIVLTLLTGVLIITVLIMMIIPQIVTSIMTLADSLPSQVNAYYKNIVAMIEDNRFLADTMQEVVLQATEFVDNKMMTEFIPWLRTELLPNINTFAKPFMDGIAAVFNVLYNLLIGLIVAIYLMKSKRIFAAQSKKLVYGIFKKSHADMIIYYVRISNNMFSGFISGKIVDSTIIGIICFVVMSIMQLPYALLVSVIVGVTNVIPVFGPYIGAIPSILLILLVDPMQALYFLILIVVLQQLDGNVIGPAILGESTGLSAFWVLFSILFFGGLWGIFGMLIGCPLFAVIYRIIRDFIAMRLEKRSLLVPTQSYMDLKQIDVEGKDVQYIKYSADELQGKKEKKAPVKEGVLLKFIDKVKKKLRKSSKNKEDDTLD